VRTGVVETAVITSAATAHADLVVAATQAGKAVFCEKPIALTLAGADRAVEAARTAGMASFEAGGPVDVRTVA
jgi:myo-inositol 2-dehydrogenase/D-chiro-inositol 1-dehydrogenase